jgi:hypothetical protein
VFASGRPVKLSSGDPRTAGERLAASALSLLSANAKPTTGSSQATDLTNDGSAMRVPAPSARAAIRGIEAVHMICNGRVLAITRETCTGKTGSSGELLGFGKAGTRG